MIRYIYALLKYDILIIWEYRVKLRMKLDVPGNQSRLQYYVAHFFPLPFALPRLGLQLLGMQVTNL